MHAICKAIGAIRALQPVPQVCVPRPEPTPQELSEATLLSLERLRKRLKDKGGGAGLWHLGNAGCSLGGSREGSEGAHVHGRDCEALRRCFRAAALRTDVLALVNKAFLAVPVM